MLVCTVQLFKANCQETIKTALFGMKIRNSVYTKDVATVILSYRMGLQMKTTLIVFTIKSLEVSCSRMKRNCEEEYYIRQYRGYQKSDQRKATYFGLVYKPDPGLRLTRSYKYDI